MAQGTNRQALNTADAGRVAGSILFEALCAEWRKYCEEQAARSSQFTREPERSDKGAA